MSTEYGKQITTAFRAVYQLFQEISRLFQDCDGTIGKGKRSLFGNVVTRDLSWSIDNPGQWMAAALYRFYDAGETLSGLVEGLTVYLWDDPDLAEEPLLICGQIRYRLGADQKVESLCKEWDLWKAYFKWCENPRLDEVIAFHQIADEGGRTEWCKVCAVPLYSIKSIDQVTELMERVRKAEV